MTRDTRAADTRDKFLRAVAQIVLYWENQRRHLGQEVGERERLQGAVFSLLAMLDGCDVDVPGFAVIPNTSGTESEAEWPAVDIGGGLHEHFHEAMRAARRQQKTPASRPG